jgi:hypothetical protein
MAKIRRINGRCCRLPVGPILQTIHRSRRMGTEVLIKLGTTMEKRLRCQQRYQVIMKRVALGRVCGSEFNTSDHNCVLLPALDE